MFVTRITSFICSIGIIYFNALLIDKSLAQLDTLPSAPSGEQVSLRELESRRTATIDRVCGTVVSLFDKKLKGGGSGVLIDRHGFALTNHHVVAAIGMRGKAGLSDGKTYDWELVGTDVAGDIALIQLIGKSDWPFAELGDSESVRVGQWVMAMGNPFSLAHDYTPSVSFGMVSGVKRYQGGQMVYGNCIQVDCAINPGNSGGPLMNMRGEVIGINGRAAFASRGRVNVGVGFAVSAEQIKNFIPELMSSRVAEHGTLDAQFGMRDGQVICESINEDSRAARAGLGLGDKILTLNGMKIDSANQLAGLMSMLPSNWPVHVRYEHEGKQFEFTIRLTPYTYVVSKEVLLDEEPQEKEPGSPNRGKAVPQSRLPQSRLPQLLPGSKLSAEHNRKNAKRIVDAWRFEHNRNEDELQSAAKAYRWNDRALEHGKVVAHNAITMGQDGRFTIASDDGNLFYWNDDGFFQLRHGQSVERTSIRAHLSDLSVLQTAMYACRRNDALWSELGTDCEMDGGDWLAGQRAYRIRISKASEPALILWFSMDSIPRLLQVGTDEDGTATRPSILFEDFVQIGWLDMARRRKSVAKVNAKVLCEWESDIAIPTDYPSVLGSGTIHQAANPVTASRDNDVKKVTTENIKNLVESPATFEQGCTFALDRVVKVYGAKVGKTPGYASGVIISNDGMILTANGTHLNGDRIRVGMPDGTLHVAEVIKRDRVRQLVILRIQAKTEKFFDLSKTPGIASGDLVLAVSNLFKIADGSDPLSVMLGIVSLHSNLEAKRGIDTIPYEGDVILLDMISNNPGSPGGAVVEAHSGQLVGIIGPNLESRTTGTKLNYAIPTSVLNAFAASKENAVPQVQPAKSQHVDLGIRLFRVGGTSSPAYIDRVEPGSPASKANLQPDDAILAIGDERIRTITQYDEAVSRLESDARVELTIKRGRELLRITLVQSQEGTELQSTTLPTAADAATRTASKAKTPSFDKGFHACLDKIVPSIVVIETYGGVSTGVKRGRIGQLSQAGVGPTTGLVLTENGLIITSTYNFRDKPPIITVTTHDGKKHIAKLLGRDDTRHLCLLKIDVQDKLPVAPVIPIEETRVGQWAISVGVGFGDVEPAISAGIISALGRDKGRAVQTDANISPANYGGPLISIDGRVIGICVPLNPTSNNNTTSVEWYDSGVGFAIPLSELDESIANMKTTAIFSQMLVQANTFG